MNRKADVIVVGAGAAGMTAAISAGRTGSRVLILEHIEEAGKKILSTGNGKCNFTNQVQGVECYRGQDPAFVLPALEQFGLPETLEFFEELGLIPVEKRGGYYYPASGQAASVREVLLMEIMRLQVEVHYNIGIRSIRKEKDTFFFDTKQGTYESRTCVIATGGKAVKKTGSDGSGIPYVLGFGHKVSEFTPALVQLQGRQAFLKKLAGIRADACLLLYVDGKEAARDLGEVQLTEFGVSGIPAFQVSRHGVVALTENKSVRVTLDFVPQFSEKELTGWLNRRFARTGGMETVVHSLSGFLNTKLVPVLLEEAGISPQLPVRNLSPRMPGQLATVAKALSIDIVGYKGFDAAQVCAGGVLTEELCSKTMESKLVKGLYFAGEIIDIDGICGGYNLQWAWSSGWVSGRSAGKYRR